MLHDKFNLKKLSLCLLFAFSLPATSDNTPPVFKLLYKGTYTDNVKLNQEGKSSKVNQTGLGVKYAYHSKRTDIELDTKSHFVAYSHNSENNGSYHEGALSLKTDLHPKGMNVFATVDVDNKSRSDIENALADIVSGDTVRIESYRTGFGYDVVNKKFTINAQLFYTERNSEDSVGENDGYGINLNTKNHADTNIFWDVISNYNELDRNDQTARYYAVEAKLGFYSGNGFNPFVRYYDEDNKGNAKSNRTVESSATGLGFRWDATRKLNVDLSYNKPHGSNGETDSYYNVALKWQPTERTILTYSHGERFFGDSNRFDFSQNGKHLTNRITYKEEVNVFTRDNVEYVSQGQYWCPNDVSNFNGLGDCYEYSETILDLEQYQLIDVGQFETIEDDSYSLDKTLIVDMNYRYARTNVVVSMLGNKRTNLDTDTEDRILTSEIKLLRDVGKHSNFNVSTSYRKQHYSVDLSNERIDHYHTYTLGFDKQLSKGLQLKLQGQHINRNSTTERYEYDETRMTLEFIQIF